MSKEYRQLTCRDSGADCDFLVRAETMDEAVQITIDHAKRVHGYKDVPPEMVQALRSLAKPVQV
jgi:predicted small metal-binding protein